MNRYWQCGQKFTRTPRVSKVPPIRRQNVLTAAEQAAAPIGSKDRLESPNDSHRSLPAVYRQKIFPKNCAITSVVAGVMRLIGSIFTAWVKRPATISIFLGVYGFNSPRRRMALVGILLCYLALTAARRGC